MASPTQYFSGLLAHIDPAYREILFASLFLVLWLLVGTLGYAAIEGWSLMDGFFMTFITLTTIGFGETPTLSTTGRLFTILIAFVGIGSVAFVAARSAQVLLAGQRLRQRHMMRRIKHMHDHYIICGYGRIGKRMAADLQTAGKPFVVLERDEEFVAAMQEAGVPAMVGDAEDEATLRQAGIEHAQGLITLLPEDSDNAIITDVADALGVLKGCEKEMEQRYDLLSDAKVRSIKDYNRRLQEGRLDPSKGHRHLPYIVVIVDELADLMMTAGKDIEAPIARLAQMSRAIGIHLVLATQRPSVDVITGLIKANFPSRVAYQVASKIDARTILDQNGAEGLVGNGDMLYMSGSKILRLQGPFVSVDEIDRLMTFIADQPGAGPYVLPPLEDHEVPTLSAPHAADDDGGLDDLFEEAARIIVRSQQGSVSLLQRKLSVGYTRAARIVDQLEEAGVVGAFVGSKAREVLVADDLELDEFFKARELG